MTRFGRLLNQDLKAMVGQAVSQAMSDAGVHAVDLEAAFFANATQGHMEGQHMIRGQIALREMGIGRIPVVNVENACASGATALSLALIHVQSGASDMAIAVGAEKMYSLDRERMFSVFDSAWDISRADEIRDKLVALGRDVLVPPGSTSSKPYSAFMDVYAAFSRAHMRRFGTTQRQLAAVAAKNHQHSVHNELSQYRNAYTVQEVLSAPPITYPLTVPMCSPISDGAAAVIVCSKAGLRKSNLARGRIVRVLASVIQSGSDRDESDIGNHCTALAAKRAYELAGVGPCEISVAEVHDATAMGEIIQVENLGFCEFGAGGVLAERGETQIGGRIPINPSGGLESKGHPIGATGLAQIYELVHQLRGEAGLRQVEGASMALAENGGGLHGIEEAAACVTILGKL